MTFSPTFDLMDNQVSQSDKVKGLMLKLLLKKKSMHPALGDGFLTTNTLADSEASGGGGETSAPGLFAGGQN